jgi:CBS domain-containing protein
MDIRNVMTPSPACCTRDTSLREVAQLMVDNDCGEIPVVDDRNSRRPIGVVTDRDIAVRTVARGINPLDATAGDCMSQPVVTVSAQTTLSDCCRVMEQHKIRRVPVVDNEGAICGIVALADVALQGRDKVVAEVVKEVSEPGG